MTLGKTTRSSASDRLVDAYRLYEQGSLDDARELLLWCWMGGMDALSTRQDGRVAVRLLRRLGFTTDAAEEWAALPDPLSVYRAGDSGIAWTADRVVAEGLARRFSLALSRRGRSGRLTCSRTSTVTARRK